MAFRSVTVCFLCAFWGVLKSQSTIFQTAWHQKPIALHTAYGWNDDSLIVTKLQFYLQNHTPVDSVKNFSNTIYLIVMDAMGRSQINDGLKGLTFNLGIDSLAHYRGTESGPLDPIHGMYWTWQSGYIHFKLEGSVKQKHQSSWQEFEYHLGGYRKPYTALQTWNCKSLNNYFDVSIFLEPLLRNNRFKIMSPGFEAHAASQNLPDAIQGLP